MNTPGGPNFHVIALDGPAGAGKSTIAKLVAQRLGWFHLDSGATYRAMAAAALMRGVKADDTEGLGTLASEIEIEIRQVGDVQKVMANGTDVTSIIRTPEVSKASSPVSAVPAVRERLVELQRTIASKQDTVVEGRDMGTVVFPNATVKVYLTAAPEIRARRRLKDFMQQKAEVSEEQVLAEINERDLRDSTREMSPLRPANDAYIIDTGELTPDEIADRVVAYYVDATL